MFVLLGMLSLAAVTSSLHIGWMQSTAVKGVLMCNNESAANVKLKLYDDDIGIDDLMVQGRTDAYGHFALEGHTAKFTAIGPKLNIYHTCEHKKACSRKVTFRVPKAYVSKGKIPKKVYDMGVIQLALKYKGESVDCWHR
uniref:Transthyretin-like family protein n=1 Tax=Parascaris univalens TaxID=6257 RepID=A0A915C5D9_PARUN